MLDKRTGSTSDSRSPKSDIHENEIEGHVEHIAREFRDGFDFMKKYPRSVTVFGSSMVRSDDRDYKLAEEFGGRVARELKYAIVTGGGPGIMEAANKGAYQAGGVSLGLNISLPHERTTNAYATHSLKFSYFFSRKTFLTFAAEALVFFPGGFGTFDELYSILALIQTGKIPKVPVILFDSGFWTPMTAFMRDEMLHDRHVIEKDDLSLFEIVDSLDRAIEIIAKAPPSDWWRNIN